MRRTSKKDFICTATMCGKSAEFERGNNLA